MVSSPVRMAGRGLHLSLPQSGLMPWADPECPLPVYVAGGDAWHRLSLLRHSAPNPSRSIIPTKQFAELPGGVR